MRRPTLALLVSAIACSGCATGMRAAVPTAAGGGLAQVVASDETPTAIAASTISDSEPVTAPQRPLAKRPSGVKVTQSVAPPKKKAVLGKEVPVVSEQRSDAAHGSPRASSAGYQQPELEPFDPAETFAPSEEIITPAPATPTPFKPKSEDEAKLDRFNRDILDVEVDIRPTAGDMPEDRGAQRFADQPVIDESLPSGEPADVLCAYTPWTICYRPLYFEDIALERYGKNVGCLQTGLSGVRFFGSIAALPYKMTRRPPRSCECSNGFSRPGDCPLPGYGNRRLELDAALMEAAAITAVVYIIP